MELDRLFEEVLEESKASKEEVLEESKALREGKKKEAMEKAQKFLDWLDKFCLDEEEITEGKIRAWLKRKNLYSERLVDTLYSFVNWDWMPADRGYSGDEYKIQNLEELVNRFKRF